MLACPLAYPVQNGVYAFPELGFRNHVATDAKVSSYGSYDPVGLFARAQRFGDLHVRSQMMWRSGPTYEQQPVFQFSTSPFASVPHVGMPDRWNFPWMDVQWQ
jgi:hypothetical protein